MKDPFDQVPEIFKSTEEYKRDIIAASKKAVEHLITVLAEPIVTNTEDDVSVEKLKSAVQTKKIAMFDALDMVARIDLEEINLNEGGYNHENTGIAERKTNR